jgi:hypothetical protein
VPLDRQLERDVELVGTNADELTALVLTQDIAAIAICRAAAGSVEKLDHVRDQADRLPALLLGGLPLAPFESPVNPDATALAGEPADALSRCPEGADVEKVRALARISLGVSPA